MQRWVSRGARAGLAGLALSLAASAWAFDADMVTIKVGFGAGGGFDVGSRVVAQHLGRFLPGNPDIIVQNVPGGGSMRLTRMMLGSEPTDGSVIGSISAGMALAPLLDPDNADYDPLDLQWIGSLALADSMCVVARSTGIDTIEQFVEADFLLGATSRGSLSYIIAAMAMNGLDARFRIVTGFESTADIELAMQRGEVAGHCLASYGDVATGTLRDQVNVIARFGAADAGEHESVPRLHTLIANPDLRQPAEFIEFGLDQNLSFIAPTGTPPQTMQVLRAAFDAMVLDPDFIEDAHRLGDFALQPRSGAELEALHRRNLSADPVVFEAARRLVE